MVKSDEERFVFPCGGKSFEKSVSFQGRGGIFGKWGSFVWIGRCPVALGFKASDRFAAGKIVFGKPDLPTTKIRFWSDPSHCVGTFPRNIKEAKQC